MLLEDVSASVTSLQFFCRDDYTNISILLLRDYPQLNYLKIEANSLRCIELFEAVDHACIESIEVGYGSCLGSDSNHGRDSASGSSFCIRNCSNLTSLILAASSFEHYSQFELKSEISDGI